MTDEQKAGLIMFEYNAGEGNSYIRAKDIHHLFVH